MAQSFNLGALGQFLTVNVATNTATFANAISIGNSTVNVTINSTSFSGTATASIPAYVVNTSGNYTVAGNLYFTGTNTVFGTMYTVGAVPGATGNSVSANTTALLIGNSTVYSIINSTAFSGTALTANNASYLGTVVATDYATKTYVTGLGYLTAVPAGYIQNTFTGSLTGNLNFTGANNTFSTMYTVGAVPGAVGNSVSANTTALLIGNSTVYTTINSTAFSGTVLNANNANYLGTVAAANYINNTGNYTLSGNLNFTGANNTFGTMLAIGAVPGAVGNSVSANTTTILIGNSTVYTTINATAFSGTVLNANNTNYLGTVAAANYLTNTGNFTVSGNLNFTGANSYFSGKTTYAANLVLAAGISVIDSTGSQGASNQVLTSNGSGNVYWATVSGSGGGWTGGTMANAATFSNTVTFSNVVTMTSNLAVNGAIFLSNGTGSNSGTAGQVLTSAGSGNAYWSTISGGGGGSFTNGASIAVSNLAYTNTTGTSTGIAYSFINTTSNSLDTVFA